MDASILFLVGERFLLWAGQMEPVTPWMSVEENR